MPSSQYEDTKVFQVEVLYWTTLEIYLFSGFNETLKLLFSIHERKTYSKAFA